MATSLAIDRSISTDSAEYRKMNQSQADFVCTPRFYF